MCILWRAEADRPSTLWSMSEGSQAEELAKQAAEAVRRAIAEAEDRAGELVREAETEAARVRERAEAEAAGIRERAEGDARERIESAQRALDELRGRLDQAAPAAETPQPEPTPEPEPQPTPEPGPEPPETVSPGAPEAPVSPPAQEPSQGRANGDDAAARLVAMKLAVDGKGRDEIEAELSERFGAGDRSALLDDVLARASR
jgi:hypothetical protein